MITLEVGKYYRTSEGVIHGPMKNDYDDERWPWHCEGDFDIGCLYDVNGVASYGEAADLIQEVILV